MAHRGGGRCLRRRRIFLAERSARRCADRGAAGGRRDAPAHRGKTGSNHPRSMRRRASGLTFLMRKVGPAWDPVREDVAFKALLADPKHSAPL